MYSTYVFLLIMLVDSICRKSKENESTRLVYSAYNSLGHWQGVNLHSHQVFMYIYGRINNFTWTEGSIELIFLVLVWKLFTFLKKKFAGTTVNHVQPNFAQSIYRYVWRGLKFVKLKSHALLITQLKFIPYISPKPPRQVKPTPMLKAIGVGSRMITTGIWKAKSLYTCSFNCF